VAVISSRMKIETNAGDIAKALRKIAKDLELGKFGTPFQSKPSEDLLKTSKKGRELVDEGLNSFLPSSLDSSQRRGSGK